MNNELINFPDHLFRRIELCRRCELYKTRKFPVPGRGVVPADVLFIGEGPGRVEDMTGLAFNGPTKRILDAAIKTASEWAGIVEPTVFRANCVCCRPCDSRTGPNRQPSGEEAWSCFQNLKPIAEAVAPRLVVLLGQVPTTFCTAAFPDAVSLYHPAFILRTGGLGSPTYQLFVRNLSTAFQRLKGHNESPTGTN